MQPQAGWEGGIAPASGAMRQDRDDLPVFQIEQAADQLAVFPVQLLQNRKMIASGKRCQRDGRADMGCRARIILGLSAQFRQFIFADRETDGAGLARQTIPDFRH